MSGLWLYFRRIGRSPSTGGIVWEFQAANGIFSVEVTVQMVDQPGRRCDDQKIDELNPGAALSVVI